MNIYRIRVRKFIKYRMRFVKRIQLFIKKNMKRISKFTKGFSKGENTIWNWLNYNKIKFEFQKRFSDCKDKKSLPFDFYLPDYNLCIEYQGKQHYEPINYFGGLEKFTYQQYHDELKKEYCEEKGISLLCIPYDKNIEEELDNFLFN